MDKVDHNNIDNVAKLLAQSFFDDPLYKYLFPSEKTREKKCFNYFKYELYANRDSIKDIDNLKAVTVIVNPHQRPKHVPMLITLKTIFSFGLIPLIKFGNYLSKNSKQLKEFHLLGERYLDLLAVNVSYRGRGYCDKILKDIGDGVYLETQNPNNVSLYSKYGFKLLNEIALNKKGLHYYLMVKMRDDSATLFQHASAPSMLISTQQTHCENMVASQANA